MLKNFFGGWQMAKLGNQEYLCRWLKQDNWKAFRKMDLFANTQKTDSLGFLLGDTVGSFLQLPALGVAYLRQVRKLKAAANVSGEPAIHS